MKNAWMNLTSPERPLFLKLMGWASIISILIFAYGIATNQFLVN